MGRMRVLIFAVAAGVMLLSQLALADEYDDCNSACNTKYEACLAKANKFVNDIEVQDAKIVCDKASMDCGTVCSDSEKASRSPVPLDTDDQNK
jgi:hypothetical protein